APNRLLTVAEWINSLRPPAPEAPPAPAPRTVTYGGREITLPAGRGPQRAAPPPREWVYEILDGPSQTPMAETFAARNLARLTASPEARAIDALIIPTRLTKGPFSDWGGGYQNGPNPVNARGRAMTTPELTPYARQQLQNVRQ